MKYYSLITDRNTPFQTNLDDSEELLLKKGLYEKYNGSVISSIILEDKAKLTDALSCGGLSTTGLIISKRLYDLIKVFNFHEIQFNEINGNGLDGYRFMFFN